MKPMSHDDLKEKIDSEADLIIIEVLPKEQYDEFHLPGAIHVPVHDHFEREIQKAVPDKNQPVVVYCANKQCPASEEAARKMEDLGYREVYDYEEGKADWKKAGLPVESAA